MLEPEQPYKHGWHIDAMAEHLTAITNGQLNRLLINVPPGAMKSLIAGVFFPAWEWGPMGRASMRILGSSYSEDYAKRDNGRMRDLVRSEWYQALWPEIQLKKDGEKEFSNTRMGWRKGVPFSRLTGGRGDRVIIDDPHSTEEAESDADRGRAIRIFTESVPTRVNDPEKSAIIVIMQRLHESDVSGVILSRQLGYEHLMLPMEFEPDRKCKTSIGFSDPRTVKDELLFEARFPRAVVDRDKKVLGSYATAGQFQQRPAPREGGLMKRSDFKIARALPARIRRKVRGWDLAATVPEPGKDPDWTAGVMIVETMEHEFIICGCRRFRLSPGGVQKSIKLQAGIDGTATTIRLAQDPGQAGKAQVQAMIKSLRGYTVRAERMTGDKATRVTPFSIQLEAGNVSLLMTGEPERDAWIEAYLDEMTTFPASSHDDQVDATADAFNELTLGKGYRYALKEAVAGQE